MDSLHWMYLYMQRIVESCHDRRSLQKSPLKWRGIDQQRGTLKGCNKYKIENKRLFFLHQRPHVAAVRFPIRILNVALHALRLTCTCIGSWGNRLNICNCNGIAHRFKMSHLISASFSSWTRSGSPYAPMTTFEVTLHIHHLILYFESFSVLCFSVRYFAHRVNEPTTCLNCCFHFLILIKFGFVFVESFVLSFHLSSGTIDQCFNRIVNAPVVGGGWAGERVSPVDYVEHVCTQMSSTKGCAWVHLSVHFNDNCCSSFKSPMRCQELTGRVKTDEKTTEQRLPTLRTFFRWENIRKRIVIYICTK